MTHTMKVRIMLSTISLLMNKFYYLVLSALLICSTPSSARTVTDSLVLNILRSSKVHYATPVVLGASFEQINSSMFRGTESTDNDFSKDLKQILLREFPDQSRNRNYTLEKIPDNCNNLLNRTFYKDTATIESLPLLLVDSLLKENVSYFILMYDVQYKDFTLNHVNELTIGLSIAGSTIIPGLSGFNFRNTEFYSKVSLIDVKKNTVIKYFELESDNDDLDFSEEVVEELFDKLVVKKIKRH